MPSFIMKRATMADDDFADIRRALADLPVEWWRWYDGDTDEPAPVEGDATVADANDDTWTVYLAGPPGTADSTIFPDLPWMPLTHVSSDALDARAARFIERAPEFVARLLAALDERGAQ